MIPEAKARKRAQHTIWRKANPDRVREYNRARSKRLRDEVRAGKSCTKCGESHPACLEFHHIDPATKVDRIANLTEGSREKLAQEVAKCVVLCANCHRKHHAEEKK